MSPDNYKILGIVMMAGGAGLLVLVVLALLFPSAKKSENSHRAE